MLGQVLAEDCSRSSSLMSPQHLSHASTIRGSYLRTSTGARSYSIFPHSANPPADPLIHGTDALG